jgi:hypothetical protein
VTPSALLWFVDLCSRYANAPSDAQALARRLQKHLDRKNNQVQINRVFRQFATVIPAIHAWLTSAALVGAIRAKGCSVTLSAYSSALAAIEAILAGEVPTTAWGMGKVRGVDVGFSRTLDAVALAGYLSSIPVDELVPEFIYSDSETPADCFDRMYSQSAAQRIASTLLGVNEDNVRKYVGIGPMNAQSEAALALSALVKCGMLAAADRYFDVDDLKEFVANKM